MTEQRLLGRMTLGDCVNYLEKQLSSVSGEVATAEAMLAIEDLPTDAGEYVLTCTVVEGEAADDPVEYVFSWEDLSGGE